MSETLTHITLTGHLVFGTGPHGAPSVLLRPAGADVGESLESAVAAALDGRVLVLLRTWAQESVSARPFRIVVEELPEGDEE